MAHIQCACAHARSRSHQSVILELWRAVYTADSRPNQNERFIDFIYFLFSNFLPFQQDLALFSVIPRPWCAMCFCSRSPNMFGIVLWWAAVSSSASPPPSRIVKWEIIIIINVQVNDVLMEMNCVRLRLLWRSLLWCCVHYNNRTTDHYSNAYKSIFGFTTPTFI